MGVEDILDFGPVKDQMRGIIKVVGVGGGGCNAVRNMYNEGVEGVTYAVCNTDSQSLSRSPVPVKIQLGEGLGAGGNPEQGQKEAENNLNDFVKLFSDGTKMVFVTAGMGGGTGTGAAPVVAGVAKDMGILTVGVVTIPFYFEKKRKIIKALKGVEEMRKNVDALLIVNNERLCDVYSDADIPVKEAFFKADNILMDAVKGISELITLPSDGGIKSDFRDVETTMKNGGGAIMAMGRASGEHRVEKAILNALDSPLIYGNDIGKAKRILFNIYASDEHPIFVRELQEIDDFFDELDPNIEVIWGTATDDTLGEDAKVTILATGFGIDNVDGMSDHIKKMDQQTAARIAAEQEKEAQREDRRNRYYGNDGQGKRYKRRPHIFLFRPEDLDNDDVISAVEQTPTYKRTREILDSIYMQATGENPKLQAEAPQQAEPIQGTIKFG